MNVVRASTRFLRAPQKKHWPHWNTHQAAHRAPQQRGEIDARDLQRRGETRGTCDLWLGTTT
eukprot:scaffold14033_cov54-Attheya_sp.AAC.3